MSEKSPAGMPLEFLTSGAEASPEARAVRMSGRDLSYGELLESVRKRAGFFRARGVGPGTKAAVYTDNDLEMARSLFALWAIGAVCIPVNITQKPDKLAQMENIVGPDIGFRSADYPVGFSREFPVELLAGEGEPANEFYRSSPEESSIIMFTSGTSGVPKAVPMSHRAIGHNAWETSRRVGVGPDDRLLINTPPYTTSSIIHVLTMLAGGASVVVERGILLGAGILDQIREFDCTGFGGVPVHFMRLSATLEGAQVPPRLRFLFNSGDHLPVPVIEKLREALPSVRIYCVYGLTEVAGRLCILDPEMLDAKTGSVGFPLRGMTVTVRDDEGRNAKPCEEGEVHVEGPALMSGYLNNPEVNAGVMKPWGFATGDFGYLDEDGCLFLRGRRDDIFKVGGEKVSSKMIEDAVFGFDDFEEFMVTHVSDEHMGNMPCLYYVLKKGVKFNKRQLLEHLKKVLPPTHIPVRFRQVAAIPRTSSGKATRSGLEPEK